MSLPAGLIRAIRRLSIHSTHSTTTRAARAKIVHTIGAGALDRYEAVVHIEPDAIRVRWSSASGWLNTRVLRDKGAREAAAELLGVAL